jgi:hypothetical protein
MQLQAATKLGKTTETFLASLTEEDYEDEGTLDLSQLREIISTEYGGLS